MKALHVIIAFLRASLLAVAVFYLCGIGIEHLARRKSPSRVFNLYYTVFFHFFHVTVVFTFAYIVTAAISRLPFCGLIHIPFSDHGSVTLGILLAVAWFALIRDFFYYWFHRWQHASRWLWHQHEVHHSDESMNVTTADRHHWLEHLLQTLLIVAPIEILFKGPVLTVAGSGVVVQAIGYFIHLNAPINLGTVFASPATHRIHHSLLPQHIDKNFAAVLPLWDILFGTWYAPEKGEYPPTGLSSGERITTIWQAMVWPIRKWDRMLSRRTALRSRNEASDAETVE